MIFELEQQEIAKIRFLAAEGDPRAQYELGCRCAKGLDMPQNDVQAVEWFQRAAQQGDPDAQYALGCCYADGTGVPENGEIAKKWFRRAASRGHSRAAERLGARYREIGDWFAIGTGLIVGGFGFFFLNNPVLALFFGIAGACGIRFFLKR